ncbi:sarcosine oxidase subunit gamma family protein [Mesorhizobium sp. KR9-304]|uniref:sarcosine oxidase subunit gamma family protein n=1 Tax=Mesorhizobium sp. KR9-304 TaxID=3156614 RepID=UPI0032B61F8A
MVDQLSPLAPVLRPGSHPAPGGIGVRLSEVEPGSIVQLAAWRGSESAMTSAIDDVMGLAVPDGAGSGVSTDTKAAFGFAPGKFLVVDQDEGLAASLANAVSAETGTVTDLSHGRTAIRIGGSKAEWVLGKFFAIDFSLPAFPLGSGLSTVHHDIFAQIQRTGVDQFDVYVFRSFARSFWNSLCHASEEVGYEVR